MYNHVIIYTGMLAKWRNVLHLCLFVCRNACYWITHAMGVSDVSPLPREKLNPVTLCCRPAELLMAPINVPHLFLIMGQYI